MGDELEGIVQRMIEAGEPEEAIASVIREYPTAEPAPTSGMPATAVTGAALGAASMAPAIVSGVNKVAKGVGTAAKQSAAKYAVGGVALDTAGRVARGDYEGAAKSGATAAAMSQVPKVAAAVQRSTNPAIVAARGAAGKFVIGGRAAGPMMRGANAISKIAGAATLPAMIVSSLLDSLSYGQSQAAKLDDPARSQAERDELLRQLHSMGGF